MTVYVKLHTCVYLNTSAHMYKSIYLCICRYIVTYMSVDIYNYVTDNVFTLRLRFTSAAYCFRQQI